MAENKLLEGLIPAGLSGPPRLSSCVGLYISLEAFYLASASLSGGKATIGKVVSVPLPKPPQEAAADAAKKRGFFTTDFLANREAVTQALARGLEDLGARTKNVVITLSPQISIIRYFLMPPVHKRFWKSSVPLEAKKYIPFPLEGLVSDYQVTPAISETKKNFMGVLFAVMPQLALAQLLQFVKDVGLTPVAMEPSHCSVMRLWQSQGVLGAEGEAQVRVHFDAERGYVILTSKGLPLLCREVDLPQEEYALSQKKLDLTGALDFSDRYLGIESVSKVKVTGIGDMNQRTAIIAREISLPIEKESGGDLPGAREPQWGAFAAAGSAMRSLSPSLLIADFTKTGRMREEDKTLIAILGIGLFVFLLCGCMALFNEFRIIRGKVEQSKLTSQVVATGVRPDINAGELKDKIERMRSLVGTMDALVQRNSLATKLQQMVDLIPSKIWLEGFQYSDLLNPGSFSAKGLTLSGAALYGSREQDIQAANQFKEAMEKDPVFFSGFKRIDISYSGGRGGGGGGAGAPAAQKTTFIVKIGQETK